MNVLHINQSYEVKGGTEVYIHELQKLLPQYGISSFFVAVSNSKTTNKFDIQSKGILLREKTKQEVEQLMASYFTDNKIDIIHIHSISNSNFVNFCLNKKPVVRSMHEPRMFCPGRQKFLLKSETICQKPFGLHCCVDAYTQKCQDSRQPIEIIRSYFNVKFETTIAAEKYKYILAMSNYIKNEAMLVGFPENKIILNPLFTSYIELSENSIKTDKIKRIVFAGRLHRSKGIHILIKALKHVLINRNDVLLDIIGDGDLKNQLQSMIVAESIPAEKVIFYDWQKHETIIEKIKSSYLVAFPSIYPEAFGLVGIEAMMCAKPVVAFDAGGVSTWLQNNVTGFLIDVKNTKLFGEKVEELLQNEPLYKEFSHNARKIAVEKFTPSVHLNKLIELYKSAVTQN